MSGLLFLTWVQALCIHAATLLAPCSSQLAHCSFQLAGCSLQPTSACSMQLAAICARSIASSHATLAPLTPSCISVMVDVLIWCQRNTAFFMGLSSGVIGEVSKSEESRGSILCSENLVQAKVVARKLPRPLERLRAQQPVTALTEALMTVSHACTHCF